MSRTGLRYQTAQELFAVCASASEDISAVPTRQSSLDFCRMLLVGSVPEEAITFCGYLLPDRMAIWWGCACLDQIEQSLDAYDLDVLELVRRRIEEPAAFAPLVFTSAHLARQRSAAGWIALAAGMENGRSGDLDVNPQRMLLGRAVQIGVLAGLARVATADRGAVLATFVHTGLQLAQSGGGAEVYF